MEFSKNSGFSDIKICWHGTKRSNHKEKSTFVKKYPFKCGQAQRLTTDKLTNKNSLGAGHTLHDKQVLTHFKQCGKPQALGQLELGFSLRCNPPNTHYMIHPGDKFSQERRKNNKE